MRFIQSISMLFYLMGRRLLRLVVKVHVLPENTDNLGIDPDKPVCYVMETHSVSNLMVLDMQTKRLGLPRPRAELGEGELAEWRSVYSLIPRKGTSAFARVLREDSKKLRQIIQTVNDSDGELDVQLVPVFVLWGRPVEKENSWFRALFSDSWKIANPFSKLITILLHGRKTLVQFSSAVSLQEELKRKALVGLDKQLSESMSTQLSDLRKATIGPDLSHRRTLVNDLMKTVAVKRAIVTTMQEEGIDKEQAVARARKYADELAADYSSSVIKFLEIVLSWVWNKLYDGVEVGHLERLQQSAPGNCLIYVPCHRSHIDYLLLSYVLYTNGLVPPHIAAGINLNLPVVGPILRGGGAFFMRRSFKDNPLYQAVFTEYLHANFVRGVSVEYFVEGGRSRTGRMLNARPGMLQMTVRSFLRNHDKPITFVPVYIGYEKLIEAKTYINELSGKSKKKESLVGMFRSFLKLRGSFGKVYLNFGEPFQLSDALDRWQPDWRKGQYGTDQRPPWLKEVVSQLGQEVTQRINEAAALNPVNLSGLALLSMPKRAMGEAEMIRQINLYLCLFRQLPYSESSTAPDMDGKQVIDYVERTGMVLRHEHPMGDVLYLEGPDSLLMSYYRNNALHLFILPALVASCFTNKRELSDETVVATCKAMYPFLRNELSLRAPNEGVNAELERTIAGLLDMGLLVRHWTTNELRRPTSTTVEAMQLRVLADLVRPMLERYYMGVFVLKQNGSGSLTIDEFEERMHQLAQRVAMLFELNSPDYFDKSLFKNFTETLLEQSLVSEDEEMKLVYSEALQDFNNETKAILNQQLRHSIHQVVGD
ncbi:MAG: glycerol-3-phosphate 1-O-acyltransferase PlsB [Pseudomonadota bacterium]